jgi:hypothetical protein
MSSLYILYSMYINLVYTHIYIHTHKYIHLHKHTHISKLTIIIIEAISITLKKKN